MNKIETFILSKKYINILMLKRVIVEVEHEDCWTPKIPYGSLTLGLSIYPNKNYLRSRLLVYSANKEILHKMKRNKNVIKINDYELRNSNTYIDFYNVYEGSIAGYLYDKEVTLLGNENKEGREVWVFATDEDYIHEVVSGLKSLGKVKRAVAKDFEISSFPDLTDIEKKVLLTAYMRGYFEYPRRSSTDDIAESLSLSKVTFLYHIRNVQKKLVEHYVNFYS
ncbi:helix-turn-helix domain-containing protein [Candidatus Acidianus copahuensis]|uniref:helix-turn-helix domain-containing protein n=1 Tax=Candidatus Acidianus copahuensis TaxID=1160895 RepID=UPI00064F5992|nr:helix-turn-helix domain-containing protein [Candidatus Acidianus copahuensis]